MSDLISELLARFSSRLETRAIVVDHGATAKGFEALRTHLPQGLWLVAVDENTWQVAGQGLAEVLDAHGQPWQRYDVGCHEGHECPMCDDDGVAAFQEVLAQSQATAAIAVGSGTLNDIVKLAGHRLGLATACVATAPSMNGYTSGIAAVLSEGVKTTVSCAAPRVVIADIDVMAQAPYRMLCSGLGDLMSKPVSNADWQLSALLNGTFHSPEAMEIIEAGADLLKGVAEKLPARDRQAVADLTRSLMLSGLAMCVAGSSSPASGGEHLISHYIDMTGHAYGEPCDFHGCQVGVGTLTTALFYEKFDALDPATIDVEARVAALQPWPEYREELRARFGILFEAVTKHAEAAYPTPEGLRQRLEGLKAIWPRLREEVRKTLRTEASLEAELREARCPVRYKDIEVSRERARRAIAHSKDIRNRYTILHLAWELGLLDAWTDEALGLLYEDAPN